MDTVIVDAAKWLIIILMILNLFAMGVRYAFNSFYNRLVNKTRLPKTIAFVDIIVDFLCSNYYKAIILFLAFLFVFGQFIALVQSGEIALTPPVLVALSILLATIVCIFVSVAFSPKKLFITVGAALAFIFAAVVYEAIIEIIRIIESISQ